MNIFCYILTGFIAIILIVSLFIILTLWLIVDNDGFLDD
jgi:hypothetical protein